MSRKEALEALNELTQSNVFRTKQYPALEALINAHFDMVERVEKVKDAVGNLEEYCSDIVPQFTLMKTEAWKNIIKATEAL